MVVVVVVVTMVVVVVVVVVVVEQSSHPIFEVHPQPLQLLFSPSLVPQESYQ